MGIFKKFDSMKIIGLKSQNIYRISRLIHTKQSVLAI